MSARAPAVPASVDRSLCGFLPMRAPSAIARSGSIRCRRCPKRDRSTHRWDFASANRTIAIPSPAPSTCRLHSERLNDDGEWGAQLAGTSPARESTDQGFPMSINDPTLPAWPLRILLACFIFGIIGLFTYVGIITPGMGWFLYFFLIPFWVMFPIIILGVRGALILLGTYVIGFPLAKLIVSRSDWYVKAQHDLKTKGTTTIGGMAMGGASSSGGWSSGTSGGGGFSG